MIKKTCFSQTTLMFLQYICLKNVNFLKKLPVTTSSEACALTPRKYFAKEGKNVGQV